MRLSVDRSSEDAHIGGRKKSSSADQSEAGSHCFGTPCSACSTAATASALLPCCRRRGRAGAQRK